MRPQSDGQEFDQPVGSTPVRLLAGVVAFIMFMSVLEGTIIATALPPMAKSFGMQPVTLSIGITVYIMVAAIFMPISSWVAERVGTRTVLAVAVTGFTSASLLCGASVGLPSFIAARALQALFASMMVPVGNLVLLRAAPKRDLVAIMAISTTPALVAPVIGPPLGGFITTFFSWRWIFFMNLPIGLVAATAILRFVPNIKSREATPFDATGFVLIATALVPLIYGLDMLSRFGGDWPVALALTVFGSGAIPFAVRHALRHPYPLVPLGALRHHSFTTASLTGGSCVKISYLALVFVLPLMFQVGFGMTAFQAGLLLLGQNGGDLMLKPVASRVLRRLGFRTALMASALLTALSLAACALPTLATPFWEIFALLVVNGMCRSILFTSMVSLNFADVMAEEMAGATVLANVSNQLIAAIAISFGAMLLRVGPLLRGNAGGEILIADGRIALLVLAAIGVLAIPLFGRLARDAGTEVSGYRSRAGRAADLS